MINTPTSYHAFSDDDGTNTVHELNKTLEHYDKYAHNNNVIRTQSTFESVKLIIYMADITREVMLRQEERKGVALMTTMPHATLFVDKRGTILHTSASACMLLGQSDVNLIGGRLDRVLHVCIRADTPKSENSNTNILNSSVNYVEVPFNR